MAVFVLVHGAFAESSSWDTVIGTLLERGFAVVAAANPLRGVAFDALALGDLLRSIERQHHDPDRVHDKWARRFLRFRVLT